MNRAALFLCDYTGIAAKPWAAMGVVCYLFDVKHPPGIQGTAIANIYTVGGTILGSIKRMRQMGNVVHVAAFPPCDNLTGAGARHWAKKAKADRYFQCKAAIVIEQCRMIGEMSGAPWYIENPKGATSGIFGKPTFTFDPYEYGGYLPEDDEHPLYPDILPPRDGYTKKTYIWSGGGFKVPDLKPVPTLDHFPGWKKLGGKSARTKEIRSATPRGFAQAVFEANYKDKI